MGQMAKLTQHQSHCLYHSYLLRLWVDDTPNEFSWRIALVNPRTGERWGFTDPAKLVAFLIKSVHDEQSPEQPTQGEK